MNRLNGWQRLWVLISVVWACVVLLDARTAWNRVEIVTPPTGPYSLREVKTAGKEGVAKDALIFVVVPTVALYGIGWGAAWVRRGFTN